MQCSVITAYWPDDDGEKQMAIYHRLSTTAFYWRVSAKRQRQNVSNHALYCGLRIG